MLTRDIISDEESLADLRHDSMKAARLLFEGYDFLTASEDPWAALQAFSGELHSWDDHRGTTMIENAVHSFWIRVASALHERHLFLHDEDIELLLHDESLFGRSLHETSDALFNFYRAPGWYNVAFEVGSSGGEHMLTAEMMRGRLIWGETLSRWNKVDPGWAISGSAVGAWESREDKSPASVLEMIANVDSTLALLARVG